MTTSTPTHHYWDTSAIVPLLLAEAGTEQRSQQLRTCPEMITWWGTRLECISALCRRKREASIDPIAFEHGINRLDALSEQWIQVSPSPALAARAERLLRIHPLRAADAMQLAAALVALQEQTSDTAFYTADNRLAVAASLEKFTVV
jgi:hypothetical protein